MMRGLKVPEAAVELACRFEGFHAVQGVDGGTRAHPYRCPGGYWTIGYGHRCDPDHPPITKAEARAYLQADLEQALKAVLISCPAVADGPSGRLAALVDFTFNMGSGRLAQSTLRQRVNSGQWEAVVHELRRWVYAGGRVLPGLVARREAEIALLNDCGDRVERPVLRS